MIRTLALLIFLLFLRSTLAIGQSQVAIKDSLASMMMDSYCSAALFVVVSRDSVLFQETAFKGNQVAFSPRGDSLFALGSISKTFTALAIMQLVEKGSLRLSDHLKQVAPEIPFENKWEDEHPVTIAHLLTHRAGFDDFHIAGLIKKRSNEMTALDEVMTFERSYTSNWPPGLVYSYANPGYVILGYIIEKITGVPYQTYIKSQILTPLGMQSTHFSSSVDNGQVVRGLVNYSSSPKSVAKPSLIGESAGSLCSNAHDMAKFLQFLLNVETQKSVSVLSPKYVSLMQQFQSDFELEHQVPIGYSIAMRERHFGSANIPFKGHNGSIEGFTSDYIFSDDLGLGIAVMQNAFASSNRPFLNYLVDVYAKEVPETKPLAGSDVEYVDPINWEGSYRLLNEDNLLMNFINAPTRTLSIDIADHDTIVVTRFLGEGKKYFRVSENSFSTNKENQQVLTLATFQGNNYIVLDEETLKKESPIKTQGILFIVCFGLTSGLFLLVLIAVQFAGFLLRKGVGKNLKLTFLTILPFFCIVNSSALYLSNSGYEDLTLLGTLSLQSISIFVLTLIYPFLAILSIYYLLKVWSSLSRTLPRVGYLIFTIGILLLNCYCLSFGWFAIKLWS